MKGREAAILNPVSERRPSGPAELEYLSGDFKVRRPGAYVLCAVTGTRIALGELRYWSYELQEAYATPEAMLERHREKLETGRK